ncbi:MAG: hypothetical protein KGH84_12680, partial [Paracoccaceae bacterium]|nr:hypothetical protein [Paracoccaceae bacterium]
MQLDRLQSWLRGLYSSQTVTLCVIVSALVSFAGPFGTYAAMHWLVRMVFWVVVTLFSLPFFEACRTIIGRRMRAYDYWWRAVAISAAFATVYAPFVCLQVRYLLWLGYGPFVPVEVIWLAIFLTAMVLRAIEHLSEPEISALVAQTATPEAADALSNEPRLLARLRQEVRGAILSLSVRD